MRITRYDYTVPGKELVLADALSCAPVPDFRADDSELEQETTALVQQVLQSIPASEKRLQEVKDGQDADEVCKQLCRWRPATQVSTKRTGKKKYYPVSAELLVVDELLPWLHHLIIPPQLQPEVLRRITTKSRKKLVSAARCAIRMRSQEANRAKALKSLREDLVNGPLHVFGVHTREKHALKLSSTQNLFWHVMGSPR